MDQTSSHERREGLWPQGWGECTPGQWCPETLFPHPPNNHRSASLLAGKGSLQGGMGVSATSGADEMMVPILNMSINKGEGQVGLRHLANIQDAQLNLRSR